LEPPKPPGKWWIFGRAYGTAASCILLVIGTELTIQWNYIHGVHQIGVVGQLIPFSLGVGGLLKVIFAAIFEKDASEKWCYGKCRMIARRVEWEDAAETFALVQKVAAKKKEVEGEKQNEPMTA